MGARKHQPFARARAGDVRVEAFVADAMPRSGPKEQFRIVQCFAVALGQQTIAHGFFGEHVVVHAEHQGHAEIWIARAVHGADEDLVQRGRDDADTEGAEAGFDDL